MNQLGVETSQASAVCTLLRLISKETKTAVFNGLDALHHRHSSLERVSYHDDVPWSERPIALYQANEHAITMS